MRLLILLLTLFTTSLLSAETIRVGNLPYDPPFAIAADKHGHFFGFDIDLMTEICKRIQVDCEFVPLLFTQIFMELLGGRIDLGLASISITDTREETFLFSLPYLASSGQFVSLTTTSINTTDDFQNKKIGSVEGALFKALVLEKYNNQVKVIEYSSLSEVFQALSNGNVDIAITDEETAKYWVATNSTMFKLIGSGMPIGVGYGIMANKNSSQLINRVNQALLGMEADGSYLKLYNRYFIKLSQ